MTGATSLSKDNMVTEGDKIEGEGSSEVPQWTTDEDEQSQLLQTLVTGVRDQDELERNISRQADDFLNRQANEREEKRLEKANLEKDKLINQIRKIKEKLNGNGHVGSATATLLAAELSKYEAQVLSLDTDIEQIKQRMEERKVGIAKDTESASNPGGRLPNETQREYLIRTGKITPFSKIGGSSTAKVEISLEDALLNAESRHEEEESAEPEQPTEEIRSHRVLIKPGFTDVSEDASPEPAPSGAGTPKRRKFNTTGYSPVSEETSERTTRVESNSAESEDNDIFTPETGITDVGTSGESDQVTDEDEDFKEEMPRTSRKHTKESKDKKHASEDFSGLDDGNEKLYKERLHSWVSRRSTARRKAGGHHTTEDIAHGETEEWHIPHPSVPDTEFEGGYRIPGDVYPSLFDYQKTGVQWLWELYSQKVGGIVGDEMGLGKTIQVISFLAGLHYSKKLTKPVIVVAPATVMTQWVKEFHTWWPPFRVSILHTSGSGMMNVGKEARIEEQLLNDLPGRQRKLPVTKQGRAAKRIVDRVVQDGHILVTTYSGLQTYAELLIPIDWEYAVLDEGHKIRNPNTAITLHCKELRTPNRIILSGTPMQNNLTELWSLFDFIFPMRLGNLLDFKNQFEIPIKIGGYANASNLQIQTAGKCAEMLKDAISPYLLQRVKADVASDLPQKSERVLFCRLTKTQREAYESFLAGDDMNSVLNGRKNALSAVDILRKICNHPDLQDHKNLSQKRDYNYGSGAKSGKMIVVKELLNVWKNSGHKTLLFAQHRIMLDILEKYVKSMYGINYRRMDGTTPIATRQAMVDEFNNNPEAHVFLLTTKVGGLGVNLTGADRVIIFDPDWNPSTDIQARERAWRLGQKREVEIYRLMTAGTIEEKIFHRQIFKQFLTNKILKDPKQRQTFQMQDLHDLFTLGNVEDEATETGRLFEGTETRFGGEDNGEASEESIQKESDSSLQGIEGISSIKKYQSDEQEKSPTPESSENAGAPRVSEKRIMDSLFARSGVHSALEHDQIINGKRVISADPKMIEREAQKVASEAAKELKKAEAIARTIPAGTPTWTGQFGIAGRPGNPNSSRRSGGGPSSSSVLAGLKDRKVTGEAAVNNRWNQRNGGPSAATANGSSSSNSSGKDFMRQIRDFMIAHGGKVYTQMLIDHFNRQCRSPQHTAEFKAMLNELAVLQKEGSRSGGRGAWILKEEYAAKAKDNGNGKRRLS